MLRLVPGMSLTREHKSFIPSVKDYSCSKMVRPSSLLVGPPTSTSSRVTRSCVSISWYLLTGKVWRLSSESRIVPRKAFGFHRTPSSDTSVTGVSLGDKFFAQTATVRRVSLPGNTSQHHLRTPTCCGAQRPRTARLQVSHAPSPGTADSYQRMRTVTRLPAPIPNTHTDHQVTSDYRPTYRVPCSVPLDYGITGLDHGAQT